MQADASVTDREYRECLLLYCMGWTAAEIEERASVRADKIRQWVCRDDWKGQKEAVEKMHTEKHPPQQSPILKVVANSRKDEIKEKYLSHMGEMAAEDAECWKDMQPQERLIVAPAIAALNGVHRKSLELDKEEENSDRGHISLTFLNSIDRVTVLDVQSEKLLPENNG
jgi:Putative ATPase subunit of terminase (gpP-like)